MYQLPLRFIKVSEDVSICATRIVAIMSTSAYQARRTLRDEKQAGTLINAAGRAKINSAIFLDNGSVIASPLSVQRLMTAIDKANHRDVDQHRMRLPPTMKVYDAPIEEATEEEDEEEEEKQIEGENR